MSIIVENLSFVYSPKTPYEKKAIDDISLTINDGEFVGIIGHTGSGKSTFIQHINGLIKIQSGKVVVGDINLSIKKPKPDLKKLRSEVGMVFQYPEYQLFAESVYQDVAFGPKNMKLDKDEIDKRVREAIALVGLDFDDIKERSPFEISGGQKRRVAIAGVIAMRPKVLILDEPTAGLDPFGKEQILELIVKLKESFIETIIVISHDIDEISRYATRLIVFNQAKILFDLPIDKLFQHGEKLKEVGLDIPTSLKLSQMLERRGFDIGFNYTPDSLIESILNKKGLKYNVKINTFDTEYPIDFKNTENYNNKSDSLNQSPIENHSFDCGEGNKTNDMTGDNYYNSIKNAKENSVVENLNNNYVITSDLKEKEVGKIFDKRGGVK